MSDFFSSNFANHPQPGGYRTGDENSAASNANPYDQNSLPSNSTPSWNSNLNAQNLRETPGGVANPSIWAPGVESTLKGVASVAKANPDAVLNMGAKWTQDIISEGTARMIPGLNQFMSTLRVYFAVDNYYVQKKMRKVLFSFFFKEWRRVVRSCF